jgi:hypothetical protein
LVKIFVIIAREICNAQSKQRDQLVQALQGNISKLIADFWSTGYMELVF